MNKIQKISLVGTLIAGTALCVALPLASCASTDSHNYCYFYDITGEGERYSFHNVVKPIEKGTNYYLKIEDERGVRFDIQVSENTMIVYENWKEYSKNE